ncbi:Uncharacterised protein [Zhongshania aliphaticivorans]|uniref:Outer membrane protein beta-barrel domain-containing protein n=1 Tax=Zhongshania aliphaticivorans TaxID=1470434 RepID=A0A5S9NR00_9GAMM|nr:outer membrane beta-barrel protein [Zhongshania aliphaticivorans]CAA0092926.1 Uncharacterised protein [Zhongshania aliphaticivorans]
MHQFKRLFLSLLFMFSAAAQAGYWLGVGSGVATVDISLGSESQDDVTLEMVLRAGVEINDYFSIEAQIGEGTGGFFEFDEFACEVIIQSYGGGENDCDGDPADLDGRKSRALYLRTSLPNDTWLTPYLLTGYSYNKLDFDGGNGSTSTSIEDFGYGFGVRVARWFQLEWLQQGDEDGIKINSTTLNLTIPF